MLGCDKERAAAELLRLISGDREESDEKVLTTFFSSVDDRVREDTQKQKEWDLLTEGQVSDE